MNTGRIKFVYTIVLGGLLLVLVCAPIYFLSRLTTRKISFRIIHRLHMCWFRALMVLTGVSLKIVKDDSFDSLKGPLIVAANHQSLADVPALYCALEKPSAILAKKELTRIPIFGYLMKKAGHIIVDRKARGSMSVVIKIAESKIKEGYWVHFYPEGTRSKDGHLGKFKKGAFLLSVRTGLPIIPVAISGTGMLLPKNRGSLGEGDVSVIIGSPVYPPEDSKMESLERFVSVVRDSIESMLASGQPA